MPLAEDGCQYAGCEDAATSWVPIRVDDAAIDAFICPSHTEFLAHVFASPGARRVVISDDPADRVRVAAIAPLDEAKKARAGSPNRRASDRNEKWLRLTAESHS